MPVTESLGEHSLVCGQCDTSYTAEVYLHDSGKKIAGCPACGRTCTVLGVDKP